MFPAFNRKVVSSNLTGTTKWMNGDLGGWKKFEKIATKNPLINSIFQNPGSDKNG
jgi:hypothetical protein